MALQTAKSRAGRFRTMMVKGKRYVLVPAEQFRRLAARRDTAIASKGAVDALAFADATIARSIVRDREAVGLSQKELADRAGIRVEVLNRAERGVVVPSVRTLTKIEAALVAAGLKRNI